jgi:hypothetical protein
MIHSIGDVVSLALLLAGYGWLWRAQRGAR